MLKNLVKKFTSHTLNDGEEFDEQASGGGGNGDTLLPGNLVTSTPKAYPTSTLALRSSVTGGSHYPQLRRNPLNSSNSTSSHSTTSSCATSGIGMECPTTAGTKSSQKRGRKPQQQVTQQHARASAFRRRDMLVRQQQQQQQPQLDMAMDEDLKDSGTESDEELAIIETNSIKSVPVSLTSDYYTSQQSLSASCRSSHCGSPLLDQECVSWDSFGCESGASGVRNNNGSAIGNASELEQLEVELPNHHYHTRQQFRRFLKHQQQKQECNNNNNSQVSGLPLVVQQNSAEAGGDKEALQVQQQGGDEKQKMAMGVDCETVAIGDDGTPTTDDFCISLYNKQLASPADSCGSSVDELESINGSSTAASEPSSGVKDKSVVNVEFLVPDQPVVGRGRSSFSSCKLAVAASSGGAKISTTTIPPTAINPCRSTAATFSPSSAAAAAAGGSAAEKRKWSQVQSGDLAVGNSMHHHQNHHHGVYSGDLKKDDIGGGGGVTTASSTAFRTSCPTVAPPFGATCPASVVHNAKNQVIGDTGDKANEAAMGDVRGSYTGWKYEGSIATTVVRRTPVRLVIPLGGGGGETAQPTPDQFAFPAAPPAKVSPRKKYRSTTATTTLTAVGGAVPPVVVGAGGSPTAVGVDAPPPVVVDAGGGPPTPKQQHEAVTVGGPTMTTTTGVAGAERQRPSLNFEKMREKLKNKSSRRKYANASTMAMKSKLRGWNAGYQLRSTHSECLFQPLKFPPSPTGPSQNSAE